MRTTVLRGFMVASLILSGCSKKSQSDPQLDPRASEEACVDRWLSEKGLDPYGSEPGTMYAGGTPLFDEQTGETRDRLAYIYDRHPEARARCSPR